MIRRFPTSRLIILLALAFTACASAQEQYQVRIGNTLYDVETVVTGLEVPWSIVFTPDGQMLITERVGRVRVFEDGKLREQPLHYFDFLNPGGEGGLMSLALHPQYADNSLLYLAYSYPKSGGYVVRVARYRNTGEALTDETVIIDDLPAARFHAGCRIKFGPDGKLYITTGDALKKNLAQQLGSLAGKTLRLNDDGSVPSDNPFVNTNGARPEIWSYGHRNAQGMDWQPGTGLMFQTEHGPSGFDGPGGGDEVNIIEAGKNYGWPTIHHKMDQEGMVTPLLEYTPAVAPASGFFYSGKLMPEFTSNFFFGNLRGARIIRVELNGRIVLRQEGFMRSMFGRIRHVTEGPDGAIYFSTSNRDGRGVPHQLDDRVMRIVPKKKAAGK